MVRRRYGAAAVAVAIAISGLFSGSAVASMEVDAADNAAGSGQKSSGVVPHGGLDYPPQTNAAGFERAGFWLWPEGRRGYLLAKPTATGQVVSPLNPKPETMGFSELVSVDLDTGREVARQPMTFRALYQLGAMASEHTVTIDRAAGRVFVAYGLQSQDTRDPGVGRQVCTAVPLAGMTCLAGVHVFDAQTLELIRTIKLRLTVDGTMLWPHLRAMTFVPGLGGQQNGGKLLLVAEEGMVFPVDTQANQFASTRTIANIPYVVQLDVDSGSTDWMSRLDSCRYTREQKIASDDVQNLTYRSWPTAIMRYGSAPDWSVYVGCHGSTNQTGLVVEIPLDADGFPATLPVAVSAPDLAEAASGGPPGDVVGHSVTQEKTVRTFPGPEYTQEFRADPVGGRLLLKVVDKGMEVWWVFSLERWDLLGTIGIGPFGQHGSVAGFDERTGRLYVLGRANIATEGGLFIADTRRSPLPQALVFQEVAPFGPVDGATNRKFLVAASRADHPAELYFHRAAAQSQARIERFEDAVPVSVDPLDMGFEGRTLDLDEAEGMTSTSLDGAARGYGARALLVGGAEAAARVGPTDPIGQIFGVPDQAWANTSNTFKSLGMDKSVWPFLQEHPCYQGSREVVLGSVGPDGPAVVDDAGSRGAAQPVVVDAMTRSDLEAVVSRCGVAEWQSVWSVGLFGRPPVDEPTLPWLLATERASCVEGDEPQGTVGDPVLGNAAANVGCQRGESNGFAYTRGYQVGALTVGEALSSFRIYRDPGRGVVSRVESVTRGIGLTGVLRIESVRGVAESWANGRKQPVAGVDREPGYDPGCDFERTAGTCFQRQLFGVWTPGYACGPCGDEARLVEGMSRALGANARVRLREPDPVLARGAENGFIAAIVKPDHERFSDLVLNNDLLPTVLPTLEIIRYASPTRQGSIPPPRGRQIYQFAGVEVSSSYGISCLLVYDEASNTCGASAEPPGSIAVSLTDADGKALAGGAFEVRQDADTDGVVGLKDALLPNGACVTADDGIGTCKFDALQPGSYLVSQVAAPPGYGKVLDPFVVELASGEARTVTFQNSSNVSTIAVSAADEAGKPVSGAQFAVYPDADSDGKVASDAQPAATCTTDATGSCSIQVAAGSYVLVQTSAPGGLEPIEPVAFTFVSGGQTAAVGVVNYPAGVLPVIEPAASLAYTDPPVSVVTETIDDAHQQTEQIAEKSPVSIPEAVGGTIVRVIAAPGDALRLATRNPKQGAAWTASLILFALAVMAIRRRQQAMELIQQ